MKITDLKRLVKTQTNPAKNIKEYFTKAYEWLNEFLQKLDQKEVEKLLEKLFDSFDIEDMEWCNAVIWESGKYGSDKTAGKVAITFRASSDGEEFEETMYVDYPNYSFVLGEASICIDLDTDYDDITFYPDFELTDRESYFRAVFGDSLVEFDKGGRVVIALEYFEKTDLL